MELGQLFIRACVSGDLAKIDDLIDKVDINCTWCNGETALISVCSVLHTWSIDVIRRLLQRNVDVDHRSNSDVCALEIVLDQTQFDSQIASIILNASPKGINNTNKTGQSYLWSCRTLEVESGVDITTELLHKIHGRPKNKTIPYLIRSQDDKFNSIVTSSTIELF